jgi:hypothetical protein
MLFERCYYSQTTWFDRHGLIPVSIHLLEDALSPDGTQRTLGADQRADGELRLMHFGCADGDCPIRRPLGRWQ